MAKKPCKKEGEERGKFVVYNRKIKKCEAKNLYKCGGNPNRFPDMKACEAKCKEYVVYLSKDLFATKGQPYSQYSYKNCFNFKKFRSH